MVSVVLASRKKLKIQENWHVESSPPENDEGHE
jgi:hypothetical protein